MTQALYAHMNNKRKKKERKRKSANIKKEKGKRKCETLSSNSCTAQNKRERNKK
jgi:hypothetical protein